MMIHRHDRHEPNQTSQPLTMYALRPTLLLAEQQDAEEARLQEEREQRLGGQRRAEDVAHEPRVVSPVGSERELHRDARGDADGKRPREQAHPEICERLVVRVSTFVGLCQQDGQDQAEADGERYEQIMVQGSCRELDSRQENSIHTRPSFPLL